MKTNSKGFELIKAHEGLELNAYKDAVGVWTIGYGHTKDVVPGQSINVEEAEALLIKDIEEMEFHVDGLVNKPLNSNQYSALVSLTYNIGPGNLKRSTLLKLINKGELLAAANEFLKWNKAGGQVLNGLKRRREAERKLFLTASA